MSRIVSSVEEYEPIPRPRIRRRTPKRTRLRRVSSTRRLESMVYAEKRRQFIHDSPICEFEMCFAPSEDCHHKKGRQGKNFLDRSTWMAICRKHHDWIHTHSRQARSMGLLLF